MKKIISVLVFAIFVSSFGQNPAGFRNGIALPNITERTTADSIPILGAKGEITKYIKVANLFSPLTTLINNKVDKTTSIIAGTGLSGGGNLSTNRTLNVEFGTGFNQVPQGNDSRINNGQTAFSWGNHASQGYYKSSNFGKTQIDALGINADLLDGYTSGDFAVKSESNTFISDNFFNGNVGIGTTSPTEKLDVDGNVKSNGVIGVVADGASNDPYGKISVTRGTASDFAYYGLTRAGQVGWSMGIATNNDFLIGLGAVAANIIIGSRFRLSTNGNATFNGTATATNFILGSDIRLKTNIKNLKPNHIPVNWKSFNLKTNLEDYRVGTIAQELEKTNPEFVKTDEAGYKSVKYLDLMMAKLAELEENLKQKDDRILMLELALEAIQNKN